MKQVCETCGHPVVNQKIGKNRVWLHKDYKTAWQVDCNGVAHFLHFVKLAMCSSDIKEVKQQRIVS